MEFPKTIKIDSSIIDVFRSFNISTSASYDDFNQGAGWISKLGSFTFRVPLTIEGPSGFYGGPYSPNAWTAEGGLCNMGACSYSHSPLPTGLKVGRYCSIAKGLRFLDFAHPSDWISSSVAFFVPIGVRSLSSIHHLCELKIKDDMSGFRRQEFDPSLGKEYPTIGDDVWIGENVALSLGVTIRTGSIIASGSIVTKDVPAYSIVAGTPATVRGYRFSPETIQRIIQSAWWSYAFTDFAGLDFTNPNLFLDGLEKHLEAGRINKWAPKTLFLPRDLLN